MGRMYCNMNRYIYNTIDGPINKYGDIKPHRRLTPKRDSWGAVHVIYLTSYPYYLDGFEGLRIDTRQYQMVGEFERELGATTANHLDDLLRDYE